VDWTGPTAGEGANVLAAIAGIADLPAGVAERAVAVVGTLAVSNPVP
jgi:hypothetical protein